MSMEEKQSKREALDAMASKTIAGLTEKDAGIEGLVKDGLAYAVANMKLTKVPLVGAGGGEGVLVVRDTQQRLYFDVARFDLGGGWGVRSYKALMVIHSQDVLDRWMDGSWAFEAGAEVSAGTAAAGGTASDSDQGFSMHVLSDGGASATVTARVIRVTIDRGLTEAP